MSGIPITEQNPAAVHRRADRAAWLWAGIALLILPALLFWLLQLPAGADLRRVLAGQREQTTLLLAAAMVSCAALAAGVHYRRGGRLCPTFVAITLGSCLLLIVTLLWNRLFLAYCRDTGIYTPHDIFRGAFHKLYAPLYGQRDRPVFAGSIISILLGAIWIVLIWRKRQTILDDQRLVWKILIFQLALTLAFGLTERFGRNNTGPDRIFGQYSGYGTFADDAEQFSGVSDVLRNYVSKMPQLSRYGRHYPPGMVLLYHLLSTPGVKVLGLVLPALTLLPLSGLARQLGLDRRAASAALLLYATSPGVLIFPSITPLGILTFLAAGCLYLLLREKTGTGTVFFSFLFGLACAIYVLLTFASYMLAILMGSILLIALLNRSVALKPTLKLLALSILTFAAFFLILHALTGFDIVDCFRSASNTHLDRNGHGFDDPVRYLFRSTGGILAYLLSAGFPLSILALSCGMGGPPMLFSRRMGGPPMPQDNPLLRALVYGTLLAILLSGFSGMSFLETERIWLFFTPALALLAGQELHRRTAREGPPLLVATLALALTLSCVYELSFRHHLSRPRLPGGAAMQLPEP
jgi:hypothetical protein